MLQILTPQFPLIGLPQSIFGFFHKSQTAFFKSFIFLTKMTDFRMKLIR